MTNKLLFPLSWIFLLVTAVACTSAREPADGVWIRIGNKSSMNFDRVTVNFPSGQVEYGRVEKGASTDYRRAEKAYGYAQIEVLASGKTFTLQPQDYMGERPLDPGRYTYALKLNDGGDLVLDLVKD
jgi:hypothetical protein